MSGAMLETELAENLRRWVSDGVITQEQADQIARLEATRRQVLTEGAGPTPPAPATGTRPERPSSRLPLVVEALGYLGGLLAAIAAFIFVRELWPDIGRTGWMSLAAVTAVVLLGAGALVHAEREAAFARLRSVLWALSTGSAAAFVAILVDEVWAPRSAWGPFAVSLVITAYAAVLWLRFPSFVQHLVLFAGSAATVGSFVAALRDSATPWLPGLAIWVLSLAWAGAVRARLLAPEGAGYLAASVGLLAGGAMTMDPQTVAGLLFALGTVVLLLVAGVLLERAWLFAVGAVGVFVVVPQAVDRFLPDTAVRPLTLLGVGVVLIGVALWLARRKAEQGSAAVGARSADEPPGE